jgi:hypothetical protein
MWFPLPFPNKQSVNLYLSVAMMPFFIQIFARAHIEREGALACSWY